MGKTVKYDVAIIGGGFSGMLAAVELLDNAGFPLNIIMLEKTPRQFGGGVAYGPASAESFHETNIAAKNMGFEKGGSALCDSAGVAPDQVMPRQLIGGYLRDELAAAAGQGNVQRKTGEVMDLLDKGDRVIIKLKSGETVRAGKVIIATGNCEVKELDCITTGQKKSLRFRSRYVADQWKNAEKVKIRKIPPDEPVLVIGTALSGYDAVRSLLRQGHEGKIVMMSRHGLEHFQYPERHDWPDISLPQPRFLDHLDDPRRMIDEMLTEFRELTGLDVNLEEGTVHHETYLYRQFCGHKNYLPEQVLKQWEKQIPKLVGLYTAQEYGKAVQRYAALINVLRVGAGHDICEEIKAAKDRGQVQVIAAKIHSLDITADGNMAVRYTRSRERAPRTQEFHTVISSLGANNDYTKIKSPLWRNIMDRGYTAPHPVGVGIEVMDASGRLPGSDNIYAAGVSVAGYHMVTDGILGPPAFSIPGMREGIKETARSVAEALAANSGHGKWADRLRDNNDRRSGPG